MLERTFEHVGEESLKLGNLDESIGNLESL